MHYPARSFDLALLNELQQTGFKEIETLGRLKQTESHGTLQNFLDSLRVVEVLSERIVSLEAEAFLYGAGNFCQESYSLLGEEIFYL